MKLSKEKQIRPKELYSKYIDLVKKDLKIYNFKNTKINTCPFCNNKKNSLLFEKYDFNYLKCEFCKSIFLSERPSIKILNKYYSNSNSNNFWYNEFWPKVKQNRIKYIFAKRVKFLIENKKKYKLNFNKFYDIGCGNAEFLKEFVSNYPSKVYGLDPFKSTFKSSKIKFINSTFEEAKIKDNSLTLVSVFELIEHILDPHKFLKRVHKKLKQNGTMILSFTDPLGFELQSLHRHSTQFLPPQHLNFMSIYGCYLIMKKIGFTEVEVISFGDLDIDIVKNNNRFNKTFTLIKSFVKYQNGQNFLKFFNLSSHKWLIAKK